MANSKTSDDYYEYATVNAAPSAAGYYTNEVSPRRQRVDELYFTVRGSGNMIVTVQFKAPGDTTWTDYAEYSTITYMKIEGRGAGIRWRAGVKEAGHYIDGQTVFGFNW